MPSNSSHNPIRVALVGTGNIAGTHAPALDALSGVKLVAVCDLDEAKARTVAERWGASVHNDLDKMLESEKPGSVHVLLPPPAHAWAARQCLNAGAHVFLEKPFCDSSQASEQIAELARRRGLQTGVNHNVTYLPVVLKALDLVRIGAIGAVEHVSVHFDLPIPRLGRGSLAPWMFAGTDKLLLELGPHPISVIYRFLGKVLSCSALASGDMQLPNGTRFFHTWQASFGCERGTAQLLMSLGKAYPSTWIDVVGQDGEIFIDLWRSTIRVGGRSPRRRTGNLREDLRNAMSVSRQSISNFLETNLGSFRRSGAVTVQDISFRNSIGEFYSAIARGTPVPAGAEEGTDVVEACEMVFEDAIARTRTEQGVHIG